MFKKLLVVAALVSASSVTLAAETPLAQAGLSFSGDVGLTSDYRYRGITQTENDPAIQGGFALSHESGLYAGVWASNVSFGGFLELDPYAGYAVELSSFPGAPTLDVGVWYYGYPSASDSNWAEFYAGLSFESLLMEGDSFSTTINYADDFLGDDAIGNQWYLNAGYSFPIANGLGAVGSLGYTKTSEGLFGANAKKNYIDWKVGVTYDVQSIEGFSAELAAIGTNIDTDGFDNASKRAVETGAVFTLTKSF